MRPKPRAFPSPAFALAFGVIAVGGVSGCRPPADLSSSAPEIQLVDPEDPAASVIEVTGIPVPFLPAFVRRR